MTNDCVIRQIIVERKTFRTDDSEVFTETQQEFIDRVTETINGLMDMKRLVSVNYIDQSLTVGIKRYYESAVITYETWEKR